MEKKELTTNIVSDEKTQCFLPDIRNKVECPLSALLFIELEMIASIIRQEKKTKAYRLKWKK